MKCFLSNSKIWDSEGFSFLRLSDASEGSCFFVSTPYDYRSRIPNTWLYGVEISIIWNLTGIVRLKVACTFLHRESDVTKCLMDWSVSACAKSFVSFGMIALGFNSSQEIPFESKMPLANSPAFLPRSKN